ncbi:MAG: response regulator [Lactobacillales bacterium]|nr:response regulator [Lactobacillales bacterium]
MKDVNLLTSNGVDVEKSLELFGDMEVYDETLEEFLSGVNQKISDIRRYKEASDMANYAILVHSLKSDARYLGFTNLAELSYNHEMASKSNNINYVYDYYDALMQEADRIINLVSSYLGKGTVISVVEEPKVVVKDKAILVVDDSDMIRNFISKIFDDTFEVIMAHDGKEAIDIIMGATDNKIKGILLDLNMPNVDGFEVLDYFKANGLFSKFPVSIITGADDRDSINRAFTYPIIDMLQKPFNERDVKRVVEKTVMFSK